MGWRRREGAFGVGGVATGKAGEGEERRYLPQVEPALRVEDVHLVRLKALPPLRQVRLSGDSREVRDEERDAREQLPERQIDTATRGSSRGRERCDARHGCTWRAGVGKRGTDSRCAIPDLEQSCLGAANLEGDPPELGRERCMEHV